MRVVIEIQSGARAGHKLLLQENERLVFGSSEWSDVVVPNDARIAPKHFSVIARGGQVQLRDLGGETGTLVNDLPVQEAWLNHGDLIQAGNTCFAVWVGAEPDPSTLSDSSASGAATGAAATRKKRLAIRCVRTNCPSGLVRLGGTFAEQADTGLTASEIANALSQLAPLTLIAHPLPLGVPHLVDVAAAVPLFDWLPEAAARQASPLILPPQSFDGVSELIDAQWGKNGLVCMFSKTEASKLVAHLQAAVHLQLEEVQPGGESGAEPAGAASDDSANASGETSAATSTKAPPVALLGYCWPTVLRALLQHAPAPFADRLLDGIDCVLVEASERPTGFHVYCRPEFVPQLERAGFTPAENGSSAKKEENAAE